jgi:L,D-transpeptidase YcbB
MGPQRYIAFSGVGAAAGVLIAIAALLVAYHAAASPLAEAIREQLHSAVDTRTPSRPAFAQYRMALGRYYERHAFAPAWLGGGEARDLIAALRSADRHGLDPRAYDLEWIATRLLERPAQPPDLAAIDIAMTLALFRALDDVHSGQVEPRRLGVRLITDRGRFDPVEAVLTARERGHVADALNLAAPRWPQYEALQEALSRYRAMALRPSMRSIPDGPLMVPGHYQGDLSALHELLITFGDLPSTTTMSDRYEGLLVEGVMRFQRRHGLDVDGIIGPATRAALNVPMATRVRQIELALERMRWFPSTGIDRAIGVNVPAFTLWAVERADARPDVRLESKVVVGRAMETETPLFATLVRGIEFNPYWNVPVSITVKEIVPMLRKNRRSLEREDMEIVTHASPPRIVSTVNAKIIAKLERGELRVRQRPGAKNALGRLKLLMPNDLEIYLHDTPERALFGRSRRDFSHGCIRVEKIIELAAFLTEGIGEWDAQRIEAAMQSDIAQTVRLEKPVPVVLFYATVRVGAEGEVYFFADLYGHDAVLEAAINERRAVF